jgi:hypothetical protein
MNEFTKGGGNRQGLAATDPTLNDRRDDLAFANAHPATVILVARQRHQVAPLERVAPEPASNRGGPLAFQFIDRRCLRSPHDVEGQLSDACCSQGLPDLGRKIVRTQSL